MAIAPDLSLNAIISFSSSGDERSIETLSDPLGKGSVNWAFFVPGVFFDALDIKKMTRREKLVPYEVWTQGGNFTFKVGDILYDTESAYLRWGDALQKINRGVRVVEASAVVPYSKTNPRYSGKIKFVLLRPNGTRTALDEISSHITSQDGFVRFLITGEIPNA